MFTEVNTCDIKKMFVFITLQKLSERQVSMLHKLFCWLSV